MTTFRVTRPKLSDLTDFLEIVKSTGLFDNLDPEDEDCKKDSESVLKLILESKDRILLVARDEQDQAVGYVSLHFLPYFIFRGEEGYISELFVMSKHCGKGIGSLLLDAAIDEARSRGCKRLHLINSRARDSYKRGFYSKRGWQERNHRASFVLELEDVGNDSEPGK